MTRWARATTTRSKRPLPATSWEDLRKGSSEGAGQSVPKRTEPGAGRLPLRNDPPQGKRKNKKKKEYLNEDVNGFMEYLRQNAQAGQVLASDGDRVREEIAVALKKDSRREGRRLRRQAAKKSAMVRPQPAGSPAARIAPVVVRRAACAQLTSRGFSGTWELVVAFLADRKTAVQTGAATCGKLLGKKGNPNSECVFFKAAVLGGWRVAPSRLSHPEMSASCPVVPATPVVWLGPAYCRHCEISLCLSNQ